ncbi:unnamed protein product [Cunninghamella echinulata]
MSTVAYFSADSFPDKDGDIIMDHKIYKDSMTYYFEGDWVEGGEVKDYEVEYFYDDKQNHIGARTVVPPLNSAVEKAEHRANRDYVLPLNGETMEYLCQGTEKISLQDPGCGPVRRVARRRLARKARYLVVKQPIAHPPSCRSRPHSLETTIMLSILLSPPPPPSTFTTTITTTSTSPATAPTTFTSTATATTASVPTTSTTTATTDTITATSTNNTATSLPIVEDNDYQEGKEISNKVEKYEYYDNDNQEEVCYDSEDGKFYENYLEYTQKEIEEYYDSEDGEVYENCLIEYTQKEKEEEEEEEEYSEENADNNNNIEEEEEEEEDNDDDSKEEEDSNNNNNEEEEEEEEYNEEEREDNYDDNKDEEDNNHIEGNKNNDDIYKKIRNNFLIDMMRAIKNKTLPEIRPDVEVNDDSNKNHANDQEIDDFFNTAYPSSSSSFSSSSSPSLSPSISFLSRPVVSQTSINNIDIFEDDFLQRFADMGYN